MIGKIMTLSFAYCKVGSKLSNIQSVLPIVTEDDIILNSNSFQIK